MLRQLPDLEAETGDDALDIGTLIVEHLRGLLQGLEANRSGSGVLMSLLL